MSQVELNTWEPTQLISNEFELIWNLTYIQVNQNFVFKSNSILSQLKFFSIGCDWDENILLIFSSTLTTITTLNN